MWMGHFYYWEGWESPFSYIQVLTLVPDESWNLSLAKRSQWLPVKLLSFQAEVEGSCVHSYVTSPAVDGKGGVLREPR